MNFKWSFDQSLNIADEYSERWSVEYSGIIENIKIVYRDQRRYKEENPRCLFESLPCYGLGAGQLGPKTTSNNIDIQCTRIKWTVRGANSDTAICGYARRMYIREKRAKTYRETRIAYLSASTIHQDARSVPLSSFVALKSLSKLPCELLFLLRSNKNKISISIRRKLRLIGSVLESFYSSTVRWITARSGRN